MSFIARRRALAAGATVALLAGGAVLASGPAGAAASTTLHLRADRGGKLRFTTSHLTAKAGTVTIKMVNPSTSGLPHGIAIEGKGVDKDGKTVSPGSTSTVRVKLKKGTYEFYCPVGNHKKAGMKGKLTIK